MSFIARLALLLAMSPALPAAAAPAHPLDPLEAGEIVAAVEVLSASGRIGRDTRVAGVSLVPPPKPALAAWRKGDPIPRRVLAALRTGGGTVEAVVDLAEGRLERWTPVPGAQTAILSSEWSAAERALKQDPRWRAAMRARGFESAEDIFCEGLSAGNFGAPEEAGRRLMRMPCYDISSARTNIYARPIEGVVATLDLDTGEVLEVLDLGVVPATGAAHEFDAAAIADPRPPLRPVAEAAPEGWNFTLEGREVAWDAWRLHLGFDQRFGPVLSQVGFEDGGSVRPILHRAHVSEVFVPYMDPAETWAFRTYLDAGEFGLGVLSSPLMPGLDCPANAAFFSAALALPDGRAYTRRRVMCLFERAAAAPLWRHHEALTGDGEARAATELVVRSIPSIAHYDYVVDWVFTQAGEIEVDIGATGIDSVKGVAPRTLSDPGAAAATETGALVAPGLVAVNHDHYFSIYLDLDVDGPQNRFVRERLSRVAAPPESRRRSLWRIAEDPMTEEGAVSQTGDPQVWSVESVGTATRLGRRPAYQIVGGGARSLLSPDDWPQRRAAFSAEHLWLTVRREGELYAAGAYPNQSRGGDGLPAYANGESLERADIVAWATVGFHHVTRPEDWPILSTLWRGLRLRPYGFFAENPALRAQGGGARAPVD